MTCQETPQTAPKSGSVFPLGCQISLACPFMGEDPSMKLISSRIPTTAITDALTVQTGAGPITLHDGLERFEDHVERHVALSPVIDALQVAFPDLPAVMVTAKSVIRALRRGPGHEEFDDLVAAYGALASATIAQAKTLGWTTRTSTAATLHFSPTGLLAVTTGGTLRTLFLAGFQADAETAPDWDHRPEAPAPDDAAQRYFALVVKPALHMLQRAPSQREPLRPAEYGLLPQRCSALRQGMRFHRWLDYCRLAGWDPTGDRG